MQNHTETLTAVLTINKQLYIVGEGSSAGKPTVKFYLNAAADDLFNITAANVQLRNIWFPENVQFNNGGSSAAKVTVGTTDCIVRGCYFECGANDSAFYALYISAARTRIESCTFISTATVGGASRPLAGLTTSGALADTEITSCIFDDGVYGFQTKAGFFTGGVQTRMRIESLSLLHGADIAINSSSVASFLNVQTATGGGSVVW
jgi:hypothetical protein